MYCPNCRQSFEGKFCPECGAELINEPETSGVNINLGDANAISGGVNVESTTNVQNVDNSVTNIDNTVKNIDQSVHNVDNSVKNIDQRVTNVDQSVHNTTQNVDQSVHNTTQNVTHNVTNITQVAATENDVERAAEKATQAIAVSETKRAEADILREQRIQQEIEDAKRKSKRRTYTAFIIVLLIITGIIGYYLIWRYTGKSVAEIASEAAYNTVNSTSIREMDVNTDDVPSDDPSVVIDPNGDVKAQLEQHYEQVFDLHDGFYKIKANGLLGLADPSGKVIQKPKFTNITTKNSKGLIKVQNGNKIGYLNIKGVIVIEPVYSSIEDERDGLIKVSIDGKFGFLNAQTLQVVTPCIYDYIYSKDGDKYKVKQGNKTGYLNVDGSVSQNPE